MPTIFEFLTAAWIRYRGRPVLGAVTLWMVAIPNFTVNVLERLDGLNDQPYWPGYIPTDDIVIFCFGLSLVCTLITIWGTVALFVAARTDHPELSLAAARRAANKIAGPFLLTEILRLCQTFFRLLLLIVPGVLYNLRTIFVGPILAAEGIAYRPALERSIALVQGRTAAVTWVTIGSSLLVFLPLGISLGIIESIIGALDPRLLALSDGFSAAAEAVAAAVMLCLLTDVYDYLKKTSAA